MTKTTAATKTTPAKAKSTYVRPSRSKAAVADRAAAKAAEPLNPVKPTISSLQLELDKRHDTIVALRGQLQSTTAALATRTTEYEAAAKAVDAALALSAKSDDKLAEANSKITALTTQQVLLDEEAIGLRAKAKAAAEAAAERKGELTRLLDTRNREIDRLTGELSAAKEATKFARDEQGLAESRNSELRSQLDAIRSRPFFARLFNRAG